MGTVGILDLSLRQGYLTTDDICRYIAVFRKGNRHIDEMLFKDLLESH